MKQKEPLSRKLTLGIFYLLSSSLFSLGINVITVGFIARSFGVENFGLYSAIFSFVGLFQFLSDFGLNKSLLKSGSTDITKAQISFGNALFLKTVLIFPLLFLITFFGLLSGYREKEILILILFAVSLIFDGYGTIFSSIRRILGSFKLVSFFRILKTIINLVIVIAALKLNNSVLSLAFANMILNFVVFVISLINTVFLLKPKLRLRLIRDFFGDSIIFSLNDFFLNIYGRLSTVLLSLFYDLHTVGIYGAAARFTKIANLLPNQIKFALLPTMYRILEDRENEPEKGRAGEPQKEQKVFIILLKYMIILSTLLVIYIFFFSDFIIHAIFGRKYDLAIPLVKLFSFFIYFRFVETPFHLFYIGLNEHKKMVYLQGISSLVNLVLNLILIPVYSGAGACYATIISEIIFATTLIINGSKYLIWHWGQVFSMFLKPIICGLLSIGVLTVFLYKINIFVQLFSLTVIYTLLLFGLKVFDKMDKEFFLKIFNSRKIVENI